MSPRTLAIGAGLILVVAAAALLTWSRPQHTYPLPTSSSPEGIGMQAAFEGNVVGDVRTGCLTLGSGGALAVWPEGFYALDDPPRVIRPNGEVAVRVGERIRMGGGIPDRQARRCGTTLRWIVSKVEPLRH